MILILHPLGYPPISVMVSGVTISRSLNEHDQCSLMAITKGGAVPIETGQKKQIKNLFDQITEAMKSGDSIFEVSREVAKNEQCTT